MKANIRDFDAPLDSSGEQPPRKQGGRHGGFERKQDLKI